MFGVEKACDSIREAIAELEKSSSTSPTTEDIKSLVNVRQLLDATCDQILAIFDRTHQWQDEGFLSAEQTVVHTTGTFAANVKKSLSQGEFLNRHPEFTKAIERGSISYDHIAPLVPLLEEKYVEFFDTDEQDLLETAKLMPAHHFKRVIRHWKYTVDEIRDDSFDECERFDERYLNLYQIEYGYWKIDGVLDPVTGLLAKKALESLRTKLWKTHYDRKAQLVDAGISEAESDQHFNVMPDEEYTVEKLYADSLGYLSQGFLDARVEAKTPDLPIEECMWPGYKPTSSENYLFMDATFAHATTPLLDVDLVIDIKDLKPQTSTRNVIEKFLTHNNPIVNSYPKGYIEQILCDSRLEVPIKHNDGIYDLGRSIRTAPPKLKKQLLLQQDTCTVDGCCTPAKWCDAHHIEHWAHGGATSLDNLVLICRRHHSMMHNDKYFAEKMLPRLKPKPLARTG